MVVPRADSAYDSNPGFALDLVYNLVFKLAVQLSNIKSAVPFGRSFFVPKMRHHAAEFYVRHISHRREVTHPPDVDAVSLPRRGVDRRPSTWPGRQK
jgi:hypothetical protein